MASCESCQATMLESFPCAAVPAGTPVAIAATDQTAAPPCFFARICRQRATIEKAGRSVCRSCAETRLRGFEYPLRNPSAEPLYSTSRNALEALDMVEEAPAGTRQESQGEN